MRSLCKILVVILMIVFIKISFAKDIQENQSIVIRTETITQLFKGTISEFETEDHEFSCNKTNVFSEKSEILISNKRTIKTSDILPQGNSYQCRVLSKNDRSIFPGHAFISSRELNHKIHLFGLVLIGNKSFLTPTSTPVSIEGVKLFDSNIDENPRKPNCMNASPITGDPLIPGVRDPKPIDPDDLPDPKDVLNANLRKVIIDVETDEYFMRKFTGFAAGDEENFDLVIPKALAFIENTYGQVSMIKSKDLNLTIEIDRINLYELGQAPWDDRKYPPTLLEEVKIYYNGEGWIREDLLEDELLIPRPGQEHRRGSGIFDEDEQEIMIVYVDDHRAGSGIKINRIHNEGIALVNFLAYWPSGGAGQMYRINGNFIPVFGMNLAFSVAGVRDAVTMASRYFTQEPAQPPFDFWHEDETLNILEVITEDMLVNDATYSYLAGTVFLEILDIAHEIGHNFGFDHTHERGLDRCACGDARPQAGQEDACEDFEYDFDEIGTIMSYCRLNIADFHDDDKRVLREGIRRMDPDDVRTYIHPINNHAPEILEIHTPDVIYNRGDRPFSFHIRAHDEDNDKLFYEYRFSNGKVFYSFYPRLNYLVDRHGSGRQLLTVTVYDDKFASSSQAVAFDNQTSPTNINFEIRNESNQPYDGLVTKTNEVSNLRLSFENLGGNHNIGCELIFPNGRVLQAEPVGDYNITCNFPYEFNRPIDRLELTSVIRDGDLDPIETPHVIGVTEGLNRNHAPVIDLISRSRSESGNNDDNDNDNIAAVGDIHYVLLDDIVDIGSVYVGEELSLTARAFDEEGDDVECEFGTDHGRTTQIVESSSSNDDPRISHCIINLIYDEPGVKQIVVSAYNNITNLQFREGPFGIRIPCINETRNLNQENGVVVLRLNVLDPNPTHINDFRALYSDNVGRRINVDSDRVSVDSNNLVTYVAEYSGDNLEDITCEVSIGNNFFEGEIHYNLITPTRKICFFNHNFRFPTISQIQFRLIDSETGRAVNINQVQFDDEGNPSNIGGVLRKEIKVQFPR